MRKHDEDIKNAVLVGCKFVIENGKEIINGVKKIINWFKSMKNNN